MTLISIIISIALLTLLERKWLALGQRRIGPNIVGVYGILQPIIDGIKLILKESIIKSYYLLIGPIIIIYIALILWFVIPFSINIYVLDIQLDILFIIAISSIAIYGILLGGWFSKSKYSLISTLRATSQLISYEISLGLLLLPFILVNNSLNLYDIHLVNHNYFNIPTILLFISILAETNRVPFDLLEAESELVAGYLTEYSSIIFVLYYLAEYSMLIFWSYFLYIYSNIPMIIFITLFILLRGILPRLKYNQLIILGWYYLLPISLLYYLIYILIYYI